MTSIKIDRWKDNLLVKSPMIPDVNIYADSENVYAFVGGKDGTSIGLFTLSRTESSKKVRTGVIQLETQATYITANIAYLCDPDELYREIAEFMIEHGQDVIRDKNGYIKLMLKHDSIATLSHDRERRHFRKQLAKTEAQLYKYDNSGKPEYAVYCVTPQKCDNKVLVDIQTVAGIFSYLSPRTNITWQSTAYNPNIWTANKEGFVLVDIVKKQVDKIKPIPEIISVKLANSLADRISAYKLKSPGPEAIYYNYSFRDKCEDAPAPIINLDTEEWI